MTLSMYQASVPVYLRALANLRGVMQKGEMHANDRGYEPDALLQTRLAPDMFPLLKQVQIATDLAKNGAARLAGVDAPKFDDDETTFVQLHARIDRVVEYLGTLSPGQIDGSESREVTITTRSAGELKFNGQSYLLHFSLPNLLFHCTMAYALLRQAGVALGKLDFMGAPNPTR